MDELYSAKLLSLALTAWESGTARRGAVDDGDTDLRAKLHRYLDEGPKTTMLTS